MKKVTIGFLESILTDEELEFIAALGSELELDGCFTVNHIYRELTSHFSLVHTLEYPDLTEKFNNEELIESILDKVITKGYDFYTPFAKGEASEYYLEHILRYVDTDDYEENMSLIEEYEESNAIHFKDKITLQYLENLSFNDEVEKILIDFYGEDCFKSMYFADMSQTYFLISKRNLISVLKKANFKTEEDLKECKCDYFYMDFKDLE